MQVSINCSVGASGWLRVHVTQRGPDSERIAASGAREVICSGEDHTLRVGVSSADPYNTGVNTGLPFVLGTAFVDASLQGKSVV